MIFKTDCGNFDYMNNICLCSGGKCEPRDCGDFMDISEEESKEANK